ncbi:hypothetical protein FC52_GL000887 [Lactobacillus pasteurii DSM 23907 = CRBIP 24.76]|uniref:Bacteriophage repressor n=1 Tax=Lactobacillus pasteurii DSM 23907 = CRBIP 24.76 TaxID=1423790 RepID=I7JY83_9LACO|nr:helix-turn-helix transcriptional regulator [Lactobacillus pasteurii]KRK07225.1 hypothetical protein FC52_GL000887 [Lactobacillus pasteurii DSM 23907 = CRBIP 24.76]TDG76587.1 hypothetical protein C5L33_001346 [Lactobacillus pasteurii]CCI85320.1 Bacteriophage repressor [Lactobacillus pasteurii DSM 23907 = CRBIP 24.76]
MRSSSEIIDYLNELRKEQGVSISELARRVGMAKSGVSRYFNHTREFPINRAPEFAKALHVHVEDILGVDSFGKDIDADTAPSHKPTYKDLGLPYKGVIPDDLNDYYRSIVETYAKNNKVPKRDVADDL